MPVVLPLLLAAAAALLAGLPRAPSSYSPFEHPNAARRRREVVLRRMVEFGVLQEREGARLAKTDLGLIPPERRRTTGQYFLEYVEQALETKYGADMVFKGGLRVYTTLNPSMQLAAEQTLREGLRALEARTVKLKPGEHPVVVLGGSESPDTASEAAQVDRAEITSGAPAGPWTAFLDTVFGVKD